MNELLPSPTRPPLLGCPFCNAPALWAFKRDDFGIELGPAAQVETHILRLGCSLESPTEGGYGCPAAGTVYFWFEPGADAHNAETMGQVAAWVTRWNTRNGVLHRFAKEFTPGQRVSIVGGIWKGVKGTVGRQPLVGNLVPVECKTAYARLGSRSPGYLEISPAHLKPRT